jgi:hypothetical protein
MGQDIGIQSGLAKEIWTSGPVAPAGPILPITPRPAQTRISFAKGVIAA